jgi:signal transduction histidine kinase
MTASLRSRLLLGAALWTAGLCIAAVTVSTVLFVRYTSFPRLMHGAAYSHAFAFAVVALVCLVTGLSQVKRGVSPLNQLRNRLGAVHSGRDRRVAGTYPAEVQPLVDDMNALLNHQEQMVRRAVAKAGDLAHGLKTPLAVLAQEAERAETEGHTELATTIAQQVARMQRQIEYHLAHARAAASGATPGARCSLLESAQGLSRTLQRLNSTRGLRISVHISPAHMVRAQREDVDEMLGNLLDNACKWARSVITVASDERDGVIVIGVDDDGPGLPAAMREAVLQRGVRADEAAPGSGFGLAIVRDLVELYGGSIALGDSSTGGLRAEMRLPAADDAPAAVRPADVGST